MNYPLLPLKKFITPFLALLILFFLSIASFGQEVSLQQMKQLKFRHIGPVGNRIISVAGIPGDPMVYYAGAASGGI